MGVTSSRFRIGNLTLDTGRRLLLCDSKPISLGPLSYRLLLTLVEGAPDVVSHEDLINSVWGGRPVSPETISQRVKLLRDALSDDPHDPRYVELVRGQGYRLVPRVELLPYESAAGQRAGWATRIGVASALVVCAVVGIWIWLAPTGTVQGSSSIAVLPFADLSPTHDQQYLADGIAEEILNLLSKNTTLRVIARTSSFSFQGKDMDVTRIARMLGVAHILEGSVRKEGGRIRTTVRLVDGSDGSRLWSESYDRPVEDTLALQMRVATSVAAELRANLQNLADVPAKGVSAGAYDLYLRGQQKIRWQQYGEAARYFERAIAIDPEFIPAYHGLGTAYVAEIIDVRVPMAENRARLRDVVARGLRLAPDDAGLLALSAQLARYDGDMKLAEARLATALQKDPASGVVRDRYAEFKGDQGYPEEALALTRRAREVDPLNPGIYIGVWAQYLDLWNAKEAIAAAEQYREIVVPEDPTADGLIANVRGRLQGDLAGAIESIYRAVARLEPQDEGIPFWLPLTYYVIGAPQTAEPLMEPARQTSWNGDGMTEVEAYRHVVYGEIEQARRFAVSALTDPKKIWGGLDGDVVVVRLAFDALIASGEAQRAVDFLEKLAPEYARYKVTRDIDPKDFSPAPVPVKSAYSSYPALYFTDYARALRATGDEAGANRMLDHLEAILALRRKRGLFVEERYAAEALALRGQTAAALDALEKAERDRTIYDRWHLSLLHNEFFAGFRNHPRFVALLERIQLELSRQREELSRIDLPELHYKQPPVTGRP